MILEIYEPSPLEGSKIQMTNAPGRAAYDLTFYGSTCTTLQLLIKNDTGETIDTAVLQVSDSGRLQLRRKRTPTGDKNEIQS